RRWRGRRQQVVDLEVTVRRERHTREVRVVLGEWGSRLADERREHAEIRGGAEAVAAGQEQATTPDANAAVPLHRRVEIADPPDLTRRLHASDDIAVHGRGGGSSADAAGNGNDADAAFESGQRVIGDGGRREDDERTDNDGCDELHSNLPVRVSRRSCAKRP